MEIMDDFKSSQSDALSPVHLAECLPVDMNDERDNTNGRLPRISFNALFVILCYNKVTYLSTNFENGTNDKHRFLKFK